MLSLTSANNGNVKFLKVGWFKVDTHVSSLGAVQPRLQIWLKLMTGRVL